MNKLLTIIFAIIIYCTSLSAAELYVNGGTGNDSNTYAQVAAGTHLWATIGRAAWGSTDRDAMVSGEAAQAGDTVHIAPGTYTMSGLTNWETNLRYEIVYNPVNSGTSGNEITFKAEYPASYNDSNLTILQTEALDVGGLDGQPVIGANGVSYIVWDGFYIDVDDNSIHADTGPVVLWGSSEYITIKNCHLIGAGAVITYFDNVPAIRIEGSQHALIKNNKVHGFYTDNGSTHFNGNGLQSYHSYNMTIENNEFYDNGAGMYIKIHLTSPTGNNRIRYNVFRDNGSINVQIHQLITGQTTQVYQNIFRDSEYGIRLFGFDNGSPVDCDIVNNTFYNHSGGAVYTHAALYYDGNRFYNNIVSTTGVAQFGEDITTPSWVYYSDGDYLSDYNSYYNYTNFGRFNYTNITLATWQSTYGQEPNNVETADPLFTDVGNDDYTLQGGSPCIDAGLDILDLDGDSSTVDTITLGAYITGSEIIGIDDGDVDTSLGVSTMGSGCGNSR